jgi:hypothetical protein
MKPAPRNIRRTIVTRAESFRKWRVRTRPAWSKATRELRTLLRQCRSDAEEDYVWDIAGKDTPGRDPEKEIHYWAEKVLARLPAHDGKVKAAANEVLQEHIAKTLAHDQAKAIWLFERVCKATYYLKAKCEKAACDGQF